MKLLVTPAEAVEIQQMALRCEWGSDGYDERKWLAFMWQRFGILPGQYDMVIRFDRTSISPQERLAP